MPTHIPHIWDNCICIVKQPPLESDKNYWKGHFRCDTFCISNVVYIHICCTNFAVYGEQLFRRVYGATAHGTYRLTLMHVF